LNFSTSPMSGHLIAFEGLDQSGKQTQAERCATG
jgi:thymidylate kinase